MFPKPGAYSRPLFLAWFILKVTFLTVSAATLCQDMKLNFEQGDQDVIMNGDFLLWNLYVFRILFSWTLFNLYGVLPSKVLPLWTFCFASDAKWLCCVSGHPSKILVEWSVWSVLFSCSPVWFSPVQRSQACSYSYTGLCTAAVWRFPLRSSKFSLEI